MIIRENDIILLENDMWVYADIPEKFLMPDSPFMNREIHDLLRVGWPYRNSTDIRAIHESVSNEISLLYRKISGSNLAPDILKRFVEYTLPKPAEEIFVIPEGEYLVLLITEADKGVRKVFAEQYIDNPQASKIRISFYQGTKEPGNIDHLTVARNLFE